MRPNIAIASPDTTVSLEQEESLSVRLNQYKYTSPPLTLADVGVVSQFEI